MKNIFTIILLWMLLINTGFAISFDEVLTKEDDQTEKHDLLKSNLGISNKDTTVHGWKFRANNHLKKHIKKGNLLYVYEVVYAEDGQPVRWGDTSQKFQLRGLVCTTADSDCDRENEEQMARIETPVKDNFHMKPNSEYWVTWSIYVPEDYVLIHTKTGLGQFHSNQGPMPSQWEFKLFNDSKKSGFQLWNSVSGGIEKRFDACFGSSSSLSTMSAYNDVKPTFHWCEKEYWKYNLMSLEEFYSHRGKWIDFIINVKWGQKDNGHFKLWINGKQSVNHQGKTMHDSKQYKSDYKATFTYGMYNNNERGKFGVTNKRFEQPLTIYWDEVWRMESCQKLKLERLGYSCDALDESGKTEPDIVKDKTS